MSERTRPNVLLMIADDCGRELGFNGNRAIRTPRLDALAAEGVSFDQAFCTTASCSPSRSVIYSGLHNHQNGMYGLNHGINFFHTFPWVRTLPRIFNEAGYRTGIINKVHVGGRETYPFTLYADGHSRDGQAIARQAADFFHGKSPFFLVIGYVDPHRDDTRGGFGNRDYPGIDRHVYDPSAIQVPSYLPDLPEVRRELAAYYESIDRLDQGVGMVLDGLQRSGHADDTLVVFLSDNGPPFINSKTTLYDAGIHLPLLMRIPGGPRGIRNPNLVSYIDLLPTFMDFAGIAPLPAPAANASDAAQTAYDADRKRRGRSLLPIAASAAPQPGWDHIHASHSFHEITNCYPVRVLRDRRYKYCKNVFWRLDFPFALDLYVSQTWEAVKRSRLPIGNRSAHDYIRRPLEELYDLATDPDECHNLAGDPTHADRLRTMRSQVEAFQMETEDPWLLRDGVNLLHARRHQQEGLVIPDSHDMQYPGSETTDPMTADLSGWMPGSGRPTQTPQR